MRTVIITLPYFFKGEGREITRMLTSGKAWRLHLRKPDATESQMRTLIEAIPPALYGRLSIHDHFRLAKEYGLGGVHLNSRNNTVPEGWQGIVSRSVHTIEETENTDADYAFFSPVFPSISKPGYMPRLSIDRLAGKVSSRIFALGGVTPDKYGLIESAGFGGAAMLGAAWRPNIDTQHFRMQFITHRTDRHTISEGAEMALEGGCRWIQLRMKDASDDDIIAEGLRLRQLCRKYHATFIIDDHVELVDELEADGVHLGKNDMPVAAARKILGPMKIIGSTANTYEDIRNACAEGADYIGLGPFRFTQTKKNLSPILGIEGYRDITALRSRDGIVIPVVAIGGITDADIPDIMHTGVEGIALSSSILSAQDPRLQTAATLKSINTSIWKQTD